MERVRRLNGLWSWLPAFRVVGETEHLPTASKALGVSASALSRSIGLLERDLGVPLFRRVGGRISLNAAGDRLLIAVREAMRRLDDGVNDVSATVFLGPVHISAPSPFARVYVLPALEALRAKYRGLVPRVSSLDVRTANAQLMDGSLDIALLDDPIPHGDLTIERLAAVGYGIYCGEGHPLFEVDQPTSDDIARHPFAAPPLGEDDHWPHGRPRTIGLYLGRIDLGIEVCAQGHFLAVLPDIAARSYDKPGALKRLPGNVDADAALYAVYRKPLGFRGRTETVVDAIRAQIAMGPPE